MTVHYSTQLHQRVLVNYTTWVKLWTSVIHQHKFFDQCWVAEVVAIETTSVRFVWQLTEQPYLSKITFPSQRTIRHSQLRLSEKRILSVITFYCVHFTWLPWLLWWLLSTTPSNPCMALKTTRQRSCRQLCCFLSLRVRWLKSWHVWCFWCFYILQFSLRLSPILKAKRQAHWFNDAGLFETIN